MKKLDFLSDHGYNTCKMSPDNLLGKEAMHKFNKKICFSH